MHALMYLVHRIPFPPNKGDKIRSYHLLKHLSKHYKIFLGTFVDDAQDWQYVERLQSLCEQVYVQPLNRLSSTIKSFEGFVSGQALTLPYYSDAGMKNWVNKTINQQKITHVVVFSSAMAQYVDGEEYKQYVRMVDFVDVDSDKWTQYSQRKNWPMNWLYRREGEKLLQYERHISQEFNKSLFVSKDEAELFKTLAPDVASKIDYYNNGVDMDFFSPEHDFSNPFPNAGLSIVFTGAMDYWANEDAVCWFVEEVFPGIREKLKNASFYVVGRNPTKRVGSLDQFPGVKVTGSVPDVRPYLAFADLVVAPLRIARGVQNKVLEAMAMGKPIIATKAAVEGIELSHDFELIMANTAQEFISKSVDLLDSNNGEYGRKARQVIERNYLWDNNLRKVIELLHESL